MTHLHPLLSFVKPHEHVDDVKAGRRLVLLVNATEKCAESLRAEVKLNHTVNTQIDCYLKTIGITQSKSLAY